MQVSPVKDIKLPEYPQRDEVSPEQIKAAIPKRWGRNRAAKSAFTVLSATALAGCADAGNIAVLIDGKELMVTNHIPAPTENTACLITVAPELVVLPGTAESAAPVWPYFIAAGLVLGIVICVGSRVLRKRKKHSEKIEKTENAETNDEPEKEYEEGEY